MRKSGGKHRIYFNNADFYYIPKKFKQEATDLLTVFREAEVYLEIAVPTVLMCLASNDEIMKLPMFWEDFVYNRVGIPEDYYKYVVIHKAKWTYLRDGIADVISDFCNIALPMVHGLVATKISP